MISPPGGDGALSHGKRRLIRGGGGGGSPPGSVVMFDPGGGAPTIAAPRRMMDVDVSDTRKLSGGGGGPQSVPSRISVVLVEEAMAGGTPRLECPCDDQRERQPARGTVSDNSLGSPCVGVTLSHSGITGLDVANAPALSGGGASVGSLTDFGGGTPRRECARDDQDIQSLAGVAKPAGVTVYADGLGSPCVGRTLSSSDIAGRLLPVVPAGRSFPVGPNRPCWSRWPGYCRGPVGTMSPSDYDPCWPV